LMNMFARTARAFDENKGQALAVLRKASFVASDETGVRIEGVNAYHWVFCCKSAVAIWPTSPARPRSCAKP